MKAWITKWALTKGILEVDGDIREDVEGKPTMFKTGTGWMDIFHGEGREWHRTKGAAIAKAQEMRLKKCQSIAKQLAKLEKMEFK